GILIAAVVKYSIKGPADKPVVTPSLSTTETRVAQSDPAPQVKPAVSPRKAEADTMEIGPRAEDKNEKVEQPTLNTPPPSTQDLLAARENKSSHVDDGL